MADYDPFDPEQDLVPFNELQAAQIREIALNGVEVLQNTARQVQINSAAMSQWILASLLAMNSGGAVAILSASDKVVGSIGTPLVSFAVGAGFALATGINALITGIRVGPIIGDTIEALRISVFESKIVASTRMRVRDLMPIVRQQLIISSALAAGSMIGFGTGVASAVM